MEKAKTASYDKDKVKDILGMASQLSEKLDILIIDAFNKVEDILVLSQSPRRQASRSQSHSHTREQLQTQQAPPVQQMLWHTVESPEKLTELVKVIKALLDLKPKESINKKKIQPSTICTAPPPLPTPPMPPGFYKNISNSNSESSQNRRDRVTWAPTPQIAQIDKIPSLELTYPSPTPVVDKNISYPPPSSDSLAPYEDAATAEVRAV
ncbi:hypothetical protein AX15_007449 [Amanita polypyramis BW_CC]|nr:hypothetical protein AX15_007449 [Amanita polypyramis BW_CC]